MAGIHIRPDDLSGAEITALVAFHLAEAARFSPVCSVHAMPVERLRAPDISFWSAWDGEQLAGCIALKELDPGHGEIKSMRTAPDFLRRGVAEQLLLHLMEEARRRGYRRLSLETGRPEPFVPAHRLYAKHGFAECPPFGDYCEDPFSMCMTRAL